MGPQQGSGERNMPAAHEEKLNFWHVNTLIHSLTYPPQTLNYDVELITYRRKIQYGKESFQRDKSC